MEDWITGIMSEFGYFGVFFLILIENVFPPIPSEVILTFGGFMTTYADVSKFWLIVAATVGSVIGAMILYSFGLFLDVNRLEQVVDRWGRFLRLTKKDIHRADVWFERYGPWAVLFCRLIPLVRSLISIPAGMAHMNFLLFVVLTTIGSVIWNATLVLIGFKVGENWHMIVAYMDIYSNIVYSFIILGSLLGFIWYVRFRKGRSR